VKKDLTTKFMFCRVNLLCVQKICSDHVEFAKSEVFVCYHSLYSARYLSRITKQTVFCRVFNLFNRQSLIGSSKVLNVFKVNTENIV